MTIRAVVFDLFHTLIDTEHLRPPGFHHTIAIAELLSLDLDDYRAYWTSTYREIETTPIDLLDIVDRYLAPTGKTLTADQRVEVDGFFGTCKDEALRTPEPAMVELIAELGASVEIGVLSNCHEREVRAWPDSPFAPLVSSFTRSCDIGAMKPQPAAYEAALRPLGLGARDAVYVGNGSSDELAGAHDFGFAHVVHCNVFDRGNGLVDEPEQRRRAAQAAVSVETVAELRAAIDAEL